MKAIILEKVGGIENLLLTELEQPTIKANEVLVEVKAISVNPVDFKVRLVEDLLNMICGEARPVIIGWDIAGTVVAVGDEVTNFKAGDNVFGMVNFPGRGNAYAELVAAPESHLAKMPENISFEAAAAATLAALTALQAIKGRVKKGDRVLIHAGSGGVGHYAIQMAKNLGAYVVTTCSTRNRDFVMSLGADEHIDYRTQAFEEVATDIDFVLDGVGGDIVLKSLKVMRAGGNIISLPAPGFSDEVQALAKKLEVNIAWILVESNGADMNTIKEWLANGTLQSHISKTFSFSEMGQAHAALETGRTVGKIVVTM